MQRRIFSTLLVLLLLLGAHSAWAQQATITFLTSADEAEWAYRMAEKFEQVKGIRVEVQVESGGGIREQLPLLIAGGVAPDVSFHLIGHGVYALADSLVDLRPYVERDPEADLSLFPPVAIEAFTVPEGLPNAGKLLGIPYAIWGQVVGRNVDLWNEAGIGFSGSWTWDEFEQIARVLTRDTDGDGVPNVYGVSMPYFWPRNAIFVHRAGRYFFDRPILPTTSYLTHPTVAEVMERVQALFASGIVGGNYVQGTAAIRTDSRMSDFKDLPGNGYEHEFIPFPTFPAGIQGAEVTPHGFVILESSRNKDAAWEFVKFLTFNVESQLELGRQPGYPRIVANLAAAREIVAEQAQELHPSVPVLINTLAHPDSFPRFVHPEASRMDSILNGYFDQALRRQSISMREALLRAHDEIVPLLEAYRP